MALLLIPNLTDCTGKKKELLASTYRRLLNESAAVKK